MKRLLAFLALCLPLYLFAQGFGSFSHDQPFFAVDGSTGSGFDPYAIDLYEYWSFNDTNSSGAASTNFGVFGRDIFLSPNGAHVPTVTNGISGDARFFNDYADSVCNAYFQGKWWSGYSSWCVSMWIAPYQEKENGTIFSLYDSTLTDQRKFLLSYAGGNLRFNFNTGLGRFGNLNIYPTNTLPLSNWIYFVFGYDASATATGGMGSVWFQTNAGPRISAQVTNLLPSFTIQTENSVSISFGNVASGGQQFVGKMDEIGWWDRLLTTNEVTAFYGGGTNPLVYNAGWFSNGYVKPNSHTNLFDPMSIAGFAFGWDALRPETLVQTNQVVGPVASGVGITNWYSHGTNLVVNQNGNDWSGGGGLFFPVYYTNGFGTNASKPRVNFAKTGLQGWTPSGNGKTFGSTNTFVTVLRPTAIDMTDASTVFINRLYTSGNHIYYYGSGGTYYFGGNHGGTALFTGPQTLALNDPIVTVFQFAGGNYKVWTNGVLYTSSTVALNATLTMGTFGSYWHNGTGQYVGQTVGDFPRFWCWGRILTDDERNTIVAACRSEYEF